MSLIIMVLTFLQFIFGSAITPTIKSALELFALTENSNY